MQNQIPDLGSGMDGSIQRYIVSFPDHAIEALVRGWFREGLALEELTMVGCDRCGTAMFLPDETWAAFATAAGGKPLIVVCQTCLPFYEQYAVPLPLPKLG